MIRLNLLVVGTMLSALIIPGTALAHCDTYSGPVVQDAKLALAKGDVTPVLKWVQKNDEVQVKAAFQKTMSIRNKGTGVKEFADNYFFETLVRIHRSGEGAPYTVLKNEPPEPLITMLDKALETGNVDSLAIKVSMHLKSAITEKFKKVSSARKSADKSVEAGRDYVGAYVEYMHFVEEIHNALEASGKHGEASIEKNHEHKINRK